MPGRDVDLGADQNPFAMSRDPSPFTTPLTTISTLRTDPWASSSSHAHAAMRPSPALWSAVGKFGPVGPVQSPRPAVGSVSSPSRDGSVGSDLAMLSTLDLRTALEQMKQDHRQIMNTTLARIDQLKQENHSLALQLDQERADVMGLERILLQQPTSALSVEIEHVLNQRAELRFVEFVKSQPRPHCLMLIDGDRILFENYFLNRGKQGGLEAAIELDRLVRAKFEKIHVQDIYANGTENDLMQRLKTVVRVYLNLEQLAGRCVASKIVDDASKVVSFFNGFARASASFEVIDVGYGQNGKTEKMIETSMLHADSYACRQIFLCYAPDDVIERIADLGAEDPNKFTFVETTRLDDRECPDHEHRPYKSDQFRGLFQDLTFSHPDSITPLESLSPATDTPFNSGRQSMAVLSNYPVPKVASVVALAVPNSPKASINGKVPSSTAISWAAAVSKPATPTSPVAAERPVSRPTTAGSSQVIRNRHGQRIDPVIKYDKTEVDRMKKMKLCNVFYLKGPEACAHRNCQHAHDKNISAADLNHLRLVARMAPCKMGNDCEDASCIYGHKCAAPEGRNGENCIFGENCKFSPKQHKIERTLVNSSK